MPSYSDRRIFPYTSEQLYGLVADVEKYPDFLPWCVAARTYDPSPQGFLADLVIGYQWLRSSYTSRVFLEPPQRIAVACEKGPFTHLANEWTFISLPTGGCQVTFSVEFDFEVGVFQKLLEPFFETAAHKMLKAFETRAFQLYGVA